MTDSQKTTDHETIQQWAEERDGRPATLVGTGKGGGGGLLRIDLAESRDDELLEEISWEEFFAKFEERQLAFLYQEQEGNGEPSTFNKIIMR
jgi:hypothetical protein